jgi:hypothetical protein
MCASVAESRSYEFKDYDYNARNNNHAAKKTLTKSLKVKSNDDESGQTLIQQVFLA